MTEPALPFRVRAIADYVAASTAELSLRTGDEYSVTATDGRGVWWQSTTADGQVGWFPANYTQVIQEDVLPPPPEPEPVVEQPIVFSTPQPVAISTPQPVAATPQPVENGGANLQRSASGNNQAATAAVAKAPVRTISVGAKKVGAAAKKGVKKTGSKKKMVTPPLKSHIEKNKKNTPTTLKIQLVEARGIRAVGNDMNKTSPTCFVFIRGVMDKDPIGRKIDCTTTMKKTVEPRWNELFHLVVEDPEGQELIVRVVSGKKYDPKDTKKFLGEVKFPLRGSVRDYDAPNYQYKWYPLAGKDATGKLRIFVEFTDTRSVSGPTNFQRVSHIGWSAEGGFDISNIPNEWKQLFKSVGIKKADLADKDFAKTVFSIIQEHEKADAAPLPSGAAPTPDVSGMGAAPLPAQTQAATQTQDPSGQQNMVGFSSPDYPGWTWDGTQWVFTGDQGLPPPPQQDDSYNIPLPPAEEEPVVGGGPAPPPPPPPAPGVPAAPRPLTSSGSKKLPPPPPEDNRGSLLASIRGFSGGLKQVDSAGAPPPPAAAPSGGGSLADTLKKAMEGHRRGISGANDTTDDWSDEEGDDGDDGWDD